MSEHINILRIFTFFAYCHLVIPKKQTNKQSIIRFLSGFWIRNGQKKQKTKIKID